MCIYVRSKARGRPTIGINEMTDTVQFYLEMSELILTGGFSHNVSKLFSKLKMVTVQKSTEKPMQCNAYSLYTCRCSHHTDSCDLFLEFQVEEFCFTTGTATTASDHSLLTDRC